VEQVFFEELDFLYVFPDRLLPVTHPDIKQNASNPKNFVILTIICPLTASQGQLNLYGKILESPSVKF